MKQPIDPTGVARRRVERIGGRPGDELDAVAVEEPLEIRVDGETIGVTMRTPGDDARLALGFLFGQGILRALADVGSVSHCGKPGHAGYGNVIEVRSGPGTTLDADRILEGRRFLPASSACGVCGRQSIDDLIARCGSIVGGAALGSKLVFACVEKMKRAQQRFERTGGLHAAAAFDAAGELLCCYEDVGRHNAVDKVVGELLQLGRIGDDARAAPPALLVVSGRADFEIVQKAAAARIAIVVAVAAPTSLSIDLAARAGVTLACFARGDSMNVYTHPWRIQVDDPRPRLRAIPGASEGSDPAAGKHVEQDAPSGDPIGDRIRSSRLAEELDKLAAVLPASGGEPSLPRAAAVDADPADRIDERSGGASSESPRPRLVEVPKAPPGAPAERSDDPTTGRFSTETNVAPLERPQAGSPPAPGSAAARLAAAAEAARRRAAARTKGSAGAPSPQPAPSGPAEAEREKTPVPFAHLVPDATRGAIIVTAREQEQAEARRRSLAAELIERTDRMLQRKRSEEAGARAETAFDPFEELEDRWRAGLAPDERDEGPAPFVAPNGDSASPEPEPSWSTLESPEEEVRAVLIDDRDPGNPAPVFWPSGGAWSAGRSR